MGPANFLEYCTNCATPPKVMNRTEPACIRPFSEYIYRIPPKMATSERDTLLIRLMVGNRRDALYSAL